MFCTFDTGYSSRISLSYSIRNLRPFALRNEAKKSRTKRKKVRKEKGKWREGGAKGQKREKREKREKKRGGEAWEQRREE